MNVTPLVDVVLVLLIIFMVVAPMLEQDVRLELPAVLHIDPEGRGRTDPITVSLTPDGRLFLERDPLSAAELEARLRTLHERSPNRRVVLRGDRELRYEQARVLFALCQRIGFPGVSMRVGQRSDRQEQTP